MKLYFLMFQGKEKKKLNKTKQRKVSLKVTFCSEMQTHSGRTDVNQPRSTPAAQHHAALNV